MFFCSHYASPVGKLTVAGSETGIVGLWLAHQRFYMDILQGQEYTEQENEVIGLAKTWLDKYFSGEKPSPNELPLCFMGSGFQVQVWKRLAQIPYGQVISYGELAKEIAKKRGIRTMSAQAVGGAVGRNPISIIVPCHRVVGANGSLTGYSGGIETKRTLLELEGVDASIFR